MLTDEAEEGGPKLIEHAYKYYVTAFRESVSPAEASAVINVDGAGGTFAGSSNIGSTATGTVASGVVNGTFMSNANGRFPGSLNLMDSGNNPISVGQGAFYIAGLNQGFFIENDGVQVSLGYFVTATPSP
jgi:hypothetical protein